MNDLPDIRAYSSFLVFNPRLKCKKYEYREQKKCHEDINVSSAIHGCYYSPKKLRDWLKKTRIFLMIFQ